jgi:hypothetical protein
MEDIIPILSALILCLITFFISKNWLKKYDTKNKIQSIDTNRKMDFGKLIILQISGIKIGSVILIIIILLKIIYLFFK